MDDHRRDGVCSRMGKVAQDFRALFADTLPLAAYARLAMPVLLLEGETTPAPPKAVARRLLQVLPDAAHVRIAGAGHMGPITHAEAVNDEILGFVVAVGARRALGHAAGRGRPGARGWPAGRADARPQASGHASSVS
jgi:pimeloyl-ACP methyl ester carboxylesterase